VQHVLEVRADTAADPEHRLDQQRRPDAATFGDLRRRKQVADVIALDLEARVVFAARLEDVGNVAERVPENAIVAVGELRPLPVVLAKV
jgi:hypothetical protein